MANVTSMDFEAQAKATAGQRESAAAYHARLNKMLQTADALRAGFKGQASQAFVAAHQNLHEAATKQHRLLDETTGKLHTANTQFASTDADNVHGFRTNLPA